MNLFKIFELTQLHPRTSERDIIDLCQEAVALEAHSVCINSSYVALAKQLLEGSDVKLVSTVGFPFGTTDTLTKIHEAKTAIENGADEIDMVINLGLFKSKNYVSVLRDVTDVKLAIGSIPLKVIIEISELNKNEVLKACQICLDAKVDYIKTSTGFSKGGATLTVVKILKKSVKNRIKICAFDGIYDEETASKYLDIGVDRIGINSDFKASEVAA
ncbi:deoxyribose-phosphate aldolase [Seonamhaeicola aphaedonensis]|uniref:Deoxyribose-phosphate aldolase n=1 Tax=Seonamhaeicola aphaedonensis TaxID=1461338 RepID=A0A3D9HI86_9FLAO|nr:deoxyribose-phosphate aldolase [Seonamhaeicola aphaedonensis]RED49252.1 deoxyribose-phosphate aldolase [Seonamhaeicola aphaedonensis]